MLAGKIFVITGTLSVVRREFENLIAEHGGIADQRVTKNTDFLIVGERAGKTKVGRANKSVYGEKVVHATNESTVRSWMYSGIPEALR